MEREVLFFENEEQIAFALKFLSVTADVFGNQITKAINDDNWVYISSD